MPLLSVTVWHLLVSSSFKLHFCYSPAELRFLYTERCRLYCCTETTSHQSFMSSMYCFLFKIKKTYLCLATLGSHCCVQAFSSCGQPGLLFVAVLGLLIAVPSVEKHRLQVLGLQYLWHTGLVALRHVGSS